MFESLTAHQTPTPGLAPGVFLALLPYEESGAPKRMVCARTSDTAASRPGHAPRLGRRPCLTHRSRPPMACFPPTPVGPPPPANLSRCLFPQPKTNPPPDTNTVV